MEVHAVSGRKRASVDPAPAPPVAKAARVEEEACALARDVCAEASAAAHSPSARSPQLAVGHADSVSSDSEGDDADESSLARKRAMRAWPQWTQRAAPCISVSVHGSSVRRGGLNAAQCANTFRPAFTHQLFPRERIFGYAPGSVSIRVRYTGLDLQVRADITVCADAPVPPSLPLPPDDLHACLARALPDAALQAMAQSAAGGAPHVARALPETGNPHAPGHTTATATGVDATTGAAIRDASECSVAHLLSVRPPGVEVARYTLHRAGAGCATFVVHAWSLYNTQLQAYHNRMETLAMWLIETASPIDVADDKWRVFGLYQLHAPDTPAAAQEPAYTFAGYATAYMFRNPFQKPRPCTLRLAQLVVLPAFQRQGHGIKLFHVLNGLAHAAPVKEITVESPCPAMMRTRDAYDAYTCLESAALSSLPQCAGWTPAAAAAAIDAHCAGRSVHASTPELASSGACVGGVAEGGHARVLGGVAEGRPAWVLPPACKPLTRKQAASVAEARRITMLQAHRAYELCMLLGCDAPTDEQLRADGATLQEQAASCGSPRCAAAFVLMVRARLATTDEDIRAAAGEAADELLQVESELLVRSYLASLAALRALLHEQPPLREACALQTERLRALEWPTPPTPPTSVDALASGGGDVGHAAADAANVYNVLD